MVYRGLDLHASGVTALKEGVVFFLYGHTDPEPQMPHTLKPRFPRPQMLGPKTSSETLNGPMYCEPSKQVWGRGAAEPLQLSSTVASTFFLRVQR